MGRSTLVLAVFLITAFSLGCDVKPEPNKLSSGNWKDAMILYANRSGNSGVTSYATTADSIRVQFTNGEVYLYT